MATAVVQATSPLGRAATALRSALPPSLQWRRGTHTPPFHPVVTSPPPSTQPEGCLYAQNKRDRCCLEPPVSLPLPASEQQFPAAHRTRDWGRPCSPGSGHTWYPSVLQVRQNSPLSQCHGPACPAPHVPPPHGQHLTYSLNNLLLSV